MVHDRLDERALLRESVTTFVSRSYGIEERTAIARGAPGFSTSHWATFAELGWLMMLTPEELGGIGSPFSDAALLIEAFGTGLLLEPFTSRIVLAGTLLAAGASAPAAASALAALGEGVHVAAALREDGDGGDPSAVTTRFRAAGTTGILEGCKIAVPFASSATSFIVSARDERDALLVVLVDAGTPDVTIVESVALDGTRAATVTFSGTPVATDRVLPIADPAATLARAVDRAEAALCAEAVGVMTRAYTGAAAYVRERLQFGRPIAAFQVVRHRIVDMFVELELARAAAALAAEAIDRDDETRAQIVSLAKLQVVRSGRFVCDNAVQLHGAIGIAAEAAPSHALARMTTIATTFGDVMYHRDRYLATREGLPL